MNKTLITLTLATTIFCSMPTINAATTTKQTLSTVFNSVDTNKDGYLSEAEYKAGLNKQFTLFDTNRDSSISQEEFINAGKNSSYSGKVNKKISKKTDKLKSKSSDLFSSLDKNSDDKLSKTEFAGMAQKFKNIDTNGDNKISLNEYIIYEANKAINK